jgi:hypothetical protein
VGHGRHVRHGRRDQHGLEGVARFFSSHLHGHTTRLAQALLLRRVLEVHRGAASPSPKSSLCRTCRGEVRARSLVLPGAQQVEVVAATKELAVVADVPVSTAPNAHGGKRDSLLGCPSASMTC